MKNDVDPAFRRERALHRAADAGARGLGWFSIGLGLAELLFTRRLARATGLHGSENLVFAYGLRELASGIGILNAKRPTPWVWARVAGDALDLATLGQTLRAPGAVPLGTAVAIVSVASVTVADIACGQALDRADQASRRRFDYSHRRGLPLPPHEMRGAARADFVPPLDMVTPALLRPWPIGT